MSVNKMSNNKVIAGILKYGANIIFVGSILILSYLSFVDKFNINPSTRNITTIALVALVLNYIVWDTRYKLEYDKMLAVDMNNTDYCIHKRYYLARKGWKYNDLQQAIKNYNTNFVNFWLTDIEDLLGRTVAEIRAGGYRGHPYKLLIWQVKHRKHPKSGVKTARDLLYALSVGKSDSMKLQLKKAEAYQTQQRLKKFVSSGLGTMLAASLVYEFIADGYEGALLKLLLNVALLFTSFVFGSLHGTKGAKLKLAVAEEVCEKLEEWKGEMPTEVPFKDAIIVELPHKENVKPQGLVELEIT